MRKSVFSENGARDRPKGQDKEKQRLAKKRKAAEHVRDNAGFQDSSFQEADHGGTFSGRKDKFSGNVRREPWTGNAEEAAEESAAEKGTSKKAAKRMTANRTSIRASEGNAAEERRPDENRTGKENGRSAQKLRIRKEYAESVREELEAGACQEQGSPFSAGRRQKGNQSTWSRKNKNRASPFRSQEEKPEAFQSELKDVSLDGGRPAGRGRRPWSRDKRGGGALQRGTEEGAETVRRTLDDAVMPDEESDRVSSGTARGSYGAARLSADGARKAAKDAEGVLSGEISGKEDIRPGNAGDALSGKAGAKVAVPADQKAGSHFLTERILSPGSVDREILKKNAFYSAEESRLTAAAVEKNTALELQKRLIRKNYQRAPQGVPYIPIVSRIRERAREKSAVTAIQKTKAAARQIALFVERHPMLLIIILLSGVMLILATAALYGGASLITHSVTPSSLATSFTAEDDDILGAENDYRAMEADLNRRITDLRDQYPGYENYGLNAGQVGHDPYQLAALLTVLHDDYTQEDVQDTLRKIFDLQYNFSMHDEAGSVSKRTVRVGQSLGSVVTSAYCACEICCGEWAGSPTASGVMPTPNHTIAVDAYSPIVPMGTKVIMNGIEYTVEDTGAFAGYGVDFDVYYSDHNAALQHGHQTWEAYIADDNGSQEVEVMVSSGSQQFTAVMANSGIDHAAKQLLDADELERYELLKETKGNKPDLFPDNIYVAGGEGWFDYTIAGDALSDQKFANMMAEATKYLGYPYVWGGSSPATSFDCSGFVCWVINNCGNGWNVGRTTADGLCNILPKVPLSEAKPGDIIFFAGTYDTVGASHVGIVVGDGVMIHCGEPIQYAQYNTPYYQQHFYCVGRLS